MQPEIERDNIGIFGKMNAGKSSLMNLLTQQATSIVDASPGTTADTKTSLCEIHGIGPVRIFDTAGIDEQGLLGEKKRKKAFADLQECNLVLLVIDPSKKNVTPEKEIVKQAREVDAVLLVLYNLFHPEDAASISSIETEIPLLRFHPKLRLSVNDPSKRKDLLDFLLNHYQSVQTKTQLLPFLKPDSFYPLIIPMDVETPSGRYLRPQAMVEETITRNWAYPVSYRLDLSAARNPNECQKEKARFTDFLGSFKSTPHCIITDSQAMDIMNLWCPQNIMLTTFSIIMITAGSGGRLDIFVRGIQKLESLKPGDSILIAEACNHSRIGEDIGTVQIPNWIQKNFPGVQIDHLFGRQFEEKENLSNYSLIIHCGGCMISKQKIASRLRDLQAVQIPITNYGLFLSRMAGIPALQKVLQPWNLSI